MDPLIEQILAEQLRAVETSSSLADLLQRAFPRCLDPLDRAEQAIEQAQREATLRLIDQARLAPMPEVLACLRYAGPLTRDDLPPNLERCIEELRSRGYVFGTTKAWRAGKEQKAYQLEGVKHGPVRN